MGPPCLYCLLKRREPLLLRFQAMHPTDRAYRFLERFTTVDYRREPASSTRYWITTHISLDGEDEYGKWVYGSGLCEIAESFGCKLYA